MPPDGKGLLSKLKACFKVEQYRAQGHNSSECKQQTPAASGSASGNSSLDALPAGINIETSLFTLPSMVLTAEGGIPWAPRAPPASPVSPTAPASGPHSRRWSLQLPHLTGEQPSRLTYPTSAASPPPSPASTSQCQSQSGMTALQQTPAGGVSLTAFSDNSPKVAVDIGSPQLPFTRNEVTSTSPSESPHSPEITTPQSKTSVETPFASASSLFSTNDTDCADWADAQVESEVMSANSDTGLGANPAPSDTVIGQESHSTGQPSKPASLDDVPPGPQLYKLSHLTAACDSCVAPPHQHNALPHAPNRTSVLRSDSQTYRPSKPTKPRADSLLKSLLKRRTSHLPSSFESEPSSIHMHPMGQTEGSSSAPTAPVMAGARTPAFLTLPRPASPTTPAKGTRSGSHPLQPCRPHSYDCQVALTHPNSRSACTVSAPTTHPLLPLPSLQHNKTQAQQPAESVSRVGLKRAATQAVWVQAYTLSPTATAAASATASLHCDTGPQASHHSEAVTQTKAPCHNRGLPPKMLAEPTVPPTPASPTDSVFSWAPSLSDLDGLGVTPQQKGHRLQLMEQEAGSTPPHHLSLSPDLALTPAVSPVATPGRRMGRHVLPSPSGQPVTPIHGNPALLGHMGTLVQGRNQGVHLRGLCMRVRSWQNIEAHAWQGSNSEFRLTSDGSSMHCVASAVHTPHAATPCATPMKGSLPGKMGDAPRLVGSTLCALRASMRRHQAGDVSPSTPLPDDVITPSDAEMNRLVATVNEELELVFVPGSPPMTSAPTGPGPVAEGLEDHPWTDAPAVFTPHTGQASAPPQPSFLMRALGMGYGMADPEEVYSPRPHRRTASKATFITAIGNVSNAPDIVPSVYRDAYIDAASSSFTAPAGTSGTIQARHSHSNRQATLSQAGPDNVGHGQPCDVFTAGGVTHCTPTCAGPPGVTPHTSSTCAIAFADCVPRQNGTSQSPTDSTTTTRGRQDGGRNINASASGWQPTQDSMFVPRYAPDIEALLSCRRVSTRTAASATSHPVISGRGASISIPSTHGSGAASTDTGALVPSTISSVCSGDQPTYSRNGPLKSLPASGEPSAPSPGHELHEEHFYEEGASMTELTLNRWGSSGHAAGEGAMAGAPDRSTDSPPNGSDTSSIGSSSCRRDIFTGGVHVAPGRSRTRMEPEASRGPSARSVMQHVVRDDAADAEAEALLKRLVELGGGEGWVRVQLQARGHG